MKADIVKKTGGYEITFPEIILRNNDTVFVEVIADGDEMSAEVTVQEDMLRDTKPD